MTTAATLDAPPATATETVVTSPAVDPQRERYALDLLAAEKRGARVAKQLAVEAEAARAKLVEAVRAKDAAARELVLAEGRMQTAATLHGKAAEHARRMLRATAPAVIGECRGWVREVRRQLDRSGGSAEVVAARERQAHATIDAEAKLDELALLALAPDDLAARLQRIRDDVTAAGEVVPLPKPRPVPAGLRAAWDRLAQIEGEDLGRLSPDLRAQKLEAVRVAKEELGDLWRDGVAGSALETAITTAMETVEAAGRPEPATMSEKRRRRTYES